MKRCWAWLRDTIALAIIRYNWPLGRWRNVKHRVAIWSAVALIGTLLYFAEAYMFEQTARMQAEAAHRALIADIHAQISMGAPGSTRTDVIEGTQVMDSIKWRK